MISQPAQILESQRRLIQPGQVDRILQVKESDRLGLAGDEASQGALSHLPSPQDSHDRELPQEALY
jgi:hypothetical protein